MIVVVAGVVFLSAQRLENAEVPMSPPKSPRDSGYDDTTLTQQKMCNGAREPLLTT